MPRNRRVAKSAGIRMALPALPSQQGGGRDSTRRAGPWRHAGFLLLCVRYVRHVPVTWTPQHQVERMIPQRLKPIGRTSTGTDDATS